MVSGTLGFVLIGEAAGALAVLGVTNVYSGIVLRSFGARSDRGRLGIGLSVRNCNFCICLARVARSKS